MKSRRYTLSRLRRMLMCAALGIKAGDARGIPPYLRVLALDEKGAALLRRMRKSAAAPVIVKPARAAKAGPAVSELFELGSRAHDLFVLGRPSPDWQQGGEDYRTTPYIQGSVEDFA